jgi:hypothetical protein
MVDYLLLTHSIYRSALQLVMNETIFRVNSIESPPNKSIFLRMLLPPQRYCGHNCQAQGG